MKALFLILPLLLEVTSAAKVVCYYADWSIYGDVQPEDIDPWACTHVNYAFANLNGDGSLSATDENADITMGGFLRTTDLKKQNPNLKVILGIGPSGNYAGVASDPGKRAAMVGSARWFLETYNFDGVDIDWEVPGGGDRGNFIALLQDFRNDFNRNGWVVSAAVSADPGDGYDVGQVSNLLDHINVMTYDMYGPWSSYTGQNSALYASSVESDWEKSNLNIDAAVTNWINAGADPGKLCIGIAFYGHTFTLADPNNNGIHAPITGPGRPGPSGEEGVLNYIDVCSDQGSWGCRFDDEQQNPICVSGDQWLGYDNEQSVRAKAQYIRNRGLGGAMIWTIDKDDVHGRCGPAKILLNAVVN